MTILFSLIYKRKGGIFSKETIRSNKWMFDPMVFDEMNVYDIEFIYPSGNPKINTKDKDVINLFLSNYTM